MFLYIYAARLIYDYIAGTQDANEAAARCNGLFVKAVQEMEDVISYYYQGGSTFETDVWRAAAERASARLARRTQFADVPREAQGAEEPRAHARGSWLRVLAPHLADRGRAAGLPLVRFRFRFRFPFRAGAVGGPAPTAVADGSPTVPTTLRSSLDGLQ